MEELFEMPVSVTATLLIRVWASGSESQRRREPNKKNTAASLPAWQRQRSLQQHIVVESQVQFVGAVSTAPWLNLAPAPSRSAGADEVTEALAGCCCSASRGLPAHCELGAQRTATEHWVLSQKKKKKNYSQWLYPFLRLTLIQIPALFVSLMHLDNHIFLWLKRCIIGYVNVKMWWMDLSRCACRCKWLANIYVTTYRPFICFVIANSPVDRLLTLKLECFCVRGS